MESGSRIFFRSIIIFSSPAPLIIIVQGLDCTNERVNRLLVFDRRSVHSNLLGVSSMLRFSRMMLAPAMLLSAAWLTAESQSILAQPPGFEKGKGSEKGKRSERSVENAPAPTPVDPIKSLEEDLAKLKALEADIQAQLKKLKEQPPTVPEPVPPTPAAGPGPGPGGPMGPGGFGRGQGGKGMGQGGPGGFG